MKKIFDKIIITKLRATILCSIPTIGAHVDGSEMIFSMSL
jgi:hypothetical protein